MGQGSGIGCSGLGVRGQGLEIRLLGARGRFLNAEAQRIEGYEAIGFGLAEDSS